MRTFLSAGGLLIAFAVPAAAQTIIQTASVPLPARVFIAVNGGYQLSSNDFANGATKRENAEDGRFDTSYVVKAGPTFDVAGGAILWRQIAVGVEFSRFSVTTPAALTASIPHPFFFNRARSVAGDASGLKREETTVHLQARVVIPAGDRFQIMLFGGPSLFNVTQGIVRDYTYTDSYPYDEAVFGSATTSAVSASKVGFNVGGDVAYFFTPKVGLGGALRLAGATVNLPSAPGESQPVKIGGAQAGGGLRLRF